MQKKIYTPFIRVNDSVTKVMLDVIIALSPVILMSYLAYGIKPILVIWMCYKTYYRVLPLAYQML